MTKEMQPEALRLANISDAYGSYRSLWDKEASAELRRLHAENEQLRETLQFVERWAVHHGSKPSCTPAEALSCIQHYPPIRAITDSYTDGKRPETFDPYARIAELEAQQKRKPMTPDALADHCEAWLQSGGASNIVDAYEAGYRDCERDHADEDASIAAGRLQAAVAGRVA